MTEHAGDQATLPTSDQMMLPTTDCTVCTHPAAADIDAGLLGGTTVRSLAETYGLSRSSVGRHRKNHLSVQVIVDKPADEVEPLQIVDVHRQLAALADRLENVVAQAARTRKATAAVAATRELRQTLMAIAEIQADPDLQRAASAEALRRSVNERTGKFLVALIKFVLHEAGVDASDPKQPWGSLIAACLRVVGTEAAGAANPFGDLDTSAARAAREERALARARVMEGEVQRRVEAELRRREMQSRPAIEAKRVLELEGGAVWTA